MSKPYTNSDYHFSFFFFLCILQILWQWIQGWCGRKWSKPISTHPSIFLNELMTVTNNVGNLSLCWDLDQRSEVCKAGCFRHYITKERSVYLKVATLHLSYV